MSMNFGREMSLLRIRLRDAGSEATAAKRRAELGSSASFLGAPEKEITAAAADLLATYPAMGRAQMTAFVRTLWQSNVYELRAVGARILRERATLLEPYDLAFVEGLLRKCDSEPILRSLAEDVLGVLASRNKKLWKDLRRLGKHADPRLQRAALLACRVPLLADEGVFDRFVELAEPLLAAGEPTVLATIDEVLAAVGSAHAEAVRGFCEQHGRKLLIPAPARRAKVTARKATARKATTTKAATGRAPTPRKKVAKK